MKQAFLIKNVMEAGYDANSFAQFLTDKKDDGMNIDNWTFNGLVSVVREFRLQQDGGTSLETQTLQVQTPQKPSAPLVHQTSNDNDDVDQDAMDGSNFDQFSTTEFPDCPQIKQRDFLDCKPLAQTKFSKITLKVTGYQINKGAYFFQGDYSTFNIETQIQNEPKKLKVQRKDQDFYILRKYLRQQFPYILVPPLPSTSKKYTKLVDKTLGKRRGYFQRFLQAVSRSEILKSSTFLMEFLSITDLKQWDQCLKKQEKAKVSKSLKDHVSSSGKLNIQIVQQNILFCTKITPLINQQQVQYQEAVDISKEINLKCQNLTQSVHSLANCFERLAELNGMVSLNRKQELFEWLSRILQGTGDNIINTGELVNKYCGSHLKYHREEQDTLKELLQQKDFLEKEYLKRERQLYLKKDKLFQQKQPQKWQFNGSQEELGKRAEELFLCKAKAFKFMLSDETLQVNEMREELSYYTNQCFDEMRRVGHDNADQLTDHFITQSQLQCTYINQFHKLWAQFMSHFAAEIDTQPIQPILRDHQPVYDYQETSPNGYEPYQVHDYNFDMTPEKQDRVMESEHEQQIEFRQPRIQAFKVVAQEQAQMRQIIDESLDVPCDQEERQVQQPQVRAQEETAVHFQEQTYPNREEQVVYNQQQLKQQQQAEVERQVSQAEIESFMPSPQREESKEIPVDSVPQVFDQVQANEDALQFGIDQAQIDEPYTVDGPSEAQIDQPQVLESQTEITSRKIDFDSTEPHDLVQANEDPVSFGLDQPQPEPAEQLFQGAAESEITTDAALPENQNQTSDLFDFDMGGGASSEPAQLGQAQANDIQFGTDQQPAATDLLNSQADLFQAQQFQESSSAQVPQHQAAETPESESDTHVSRLLDFMTQPGQEESSDKQQQSLLDMPVEQQQQMSNPAEDFVRQMAFTNQGQELQPAVVEEKAQEKPESVDLLGLF